MPQVPKAVVQYIDKKAAYLGLGHFFSSRIWTADDMSVVRPLTRASKPFWGYPVSKPQPFDGLFAGVLRGNAGCSEFARHLRGLLGTDQQKKRPKYSDS